MLVLCNGMPRSASTWSYNVCLQLLAEEFSGSSIYADYNEAFLGFLRELKNEHQHAVLKSHTLDDTARRLLQLDAVKAIYTYRDPIDALASYMRMFEASFDDALSAIRGSVELYRFHRQGGRSCVIDYLTVVESPALAVRRISEYLGLSLTDDVLDRISDATGREASKKIVEQLEMRSPESLVFVNGLTYDRQTLLHRRHIRDGRAGYGPSFLTREQLDIAEAALYDAEDPKVTSVATFAG